MTILIQATKAAHAAILANPENIQRYSQYPVYDGEFWKHIFDCAKDPTSAAAVLRDISALENEPCIENDRVWRNVCMAKNIASSTIGKQSVLHQH